MDMEIIMTKVGKAAVTFRVLWGHRFGRNIFSLTVREPWEKRNKDKPLRNTFNEQVLNTVRK